MTTYGGVDEAKATIKNRFLGWLGSFGRRQRMEIRRQLSGDELRGLALVKASGGILKRGTVHVHLMWMQESGEVESRTRDGVRLYSLVILSPWP